MIKRRRLTLLGVGPMSLTVTQEAVRLANEYQTPIALIPSRRQVDSEKLGGGYVEKWSTEKFANFVRSIDTGSYALLSRDHSGPWQGSTNAKEELTFHQAMKEAKDSLENDIQAGFDLLHIDPSPALSRGFSDHDVVDMAVELIEHCVEKMDNNYQCIFEVGTDEQDTAHEKISVTNERLNVLISKLEKQRLPKPLFYVAQTGTKVAETKNCGSFDQPLTVRGSLPATVYVPEVIRILEQKEIYLKEHNADYLSDTALKWHRKFGIHGANVAPEFGVTETRSLMHLLEKTGLRAQAEIFYGIVIEGGNWKKWMLPDSRANDLKKVEIAGHYHFSDPRVIEIREILKQKTQNHGISSEIFIAQNVRNSINRYLMAFGYSEAA